MIPMLVAACCMLSGHVEGASGAPIAGASISYHGEGPQAKTISLRSDAQGNFSIEAPPGTYDVATSAPGYAGADVTVLLDADRRVVVQLEPLDSPAVRTIASVTVDGRLVPVRGAVPSVRASRTDFERLDYKNVVEGLQQFPSVTFAHPDGGSNASIAVIALRGPDPSETLIGLDGQLLNDANTGDVDLSQFPVAAFSAVDLTAGLGPQDRDTSNTIGGIVNFVSLQPTLAKHVAYSLSGGSFGTSEGWFNTTGTTGKLGYAVAADDQQQAGYVNQTETVYDPAGVNPPQVVPLGSWVSSRSALGNLTYTFSPRASLDLRAFVLGDVRDQSSSVNGIQYTAGDPQYGLFVGPGPQTFAQTIRAYQLRGRAPLGAGELVGQLARSNDNVDVNGGVSSAMYDLSHQDVRTTEALSWQREFDRSSYAIGGTLLQETFNSPGTLPQLAQNIETYFVRGGFEPTEKLRVDAAAFFSHYSTFGSNQDGRIGLSYAPDDATTLHASVGTGFRAPLLIERYVFPESQLPPPDANCIVVGQGNPNEQPEHATEYEAGVTHRFSNATLDVSLYRTNLRDPIENYYPVPACPTIQYSIPINIGSAVYEGAEARFVQRFPQQHLFLTAQYGLNVAYPSAFPVTVSNPTSGAYLVNDQQFQGIPQQQGSLELDYAQNGWHGAAQASFRGYNNELNRPPFTIVNAAAGYQTRGGVDITLAAINMFNDAAGPFTYFGGGIPYRGIAPSSGGPLAGTIANLPTDLLSVPPASVRITVTVRR